LSSKPWYPWYPTDFMAKTSALSLMERGAYVLLLDEYYTHGKALPNDMERLYRICKAFAKDERKAVEHVVATYFQLQEDERLHNKRADKEIKKQAEFLALQRAKGKAGANARWHGREMADGMAEASPEQSPEASPDAGLPQPQPQPQPHTTTTSTTTPTGGSKASRAKRASPKTPLPDGFQVSERVRKWAQEKGYDRLEQHCEAFVSKARAKGYTYADWDEGFMGAIRADWAGLRNSIGTTVADRNHQAADEWLRGGDA